MLITIGVGVGIFLSFVLVVVLVVEVLAILIGAFIAMEKTWYILGSRILR